ncbi:hypothetical protein RF11_12312 [Thelohanellus kitauei]|uniref:Uncharacterized protein n=1 Tax=Thelohanellus kitauei TaxID=669202 RepID=A0A0C2NG08_THEKT|nr:hypothetical protein RF11_12312 [Thelohanellus kitauei]
MGCLGTLISHYTVLFFNNKSRVHYVSGNSSTQHIQYYFGTGLISQSESSLFLRLRYAEAKLNFDNFKVGVVAFFSKVYIQRSGSWSRFKYAGRNELKAIKSLEEARGLEDWRIGQVELLKNRKGRVQVSSQIVSGTNYWFKIMTKDDITPIIFLQVYQGLYDERPVVKFFGTDIPE